MKKRVLNILAVFIGGVLLCSCAKPELSEPSPTDLILNENTPISTPDVSSTPQTIPPITPEPTVEPSAEPAAEQNSRFTPAVTPAPNSNMAERETEKDGWREIWDILYDYGWTMNAKLSYGLEASEFEEGLLPAAKSALSEMPPYIDALFSSSSYGPVQEHPFYPDPENDNDVNDEAHAAKALERVLRYCGNFHPEAKNVYGSTITVPESALKDYMRICFADYTEDMPIPEVEGVGIKHMDGVYRFMCNPNVLLYHGTDHYILDMRYDAVSESNDKERFYMFVVSLNDVDHFMGGSSWRVWLVKNDEPDKLGINWRVEKIVRLPNMSNGVDICDGN